MQEVTHEAKLSKRDGKKIVDFQIEIKEKPIFR